MFLNACSNMQPTLIHYGLALPFSANITILVGPNIPLFTLQPINRTLIKRNR